MLATQTVIARAALDLALSASLVLPCGTVLAATQRAGANESAEVIATSEPAQSEVTIGELVLVDNGSWGLDYQTDDFDRNTDELYLFGSVDGASKSTSSSLIDSDNRTYILIHPISSSTYPGTLALTLGLDQGTLAEYARDWDDRCLPCTFSFLASDDTIVTFYAEGTWASSGVIFLLDQKDTAALLNDVLTKGGKAIMRVEFKDGAYSLIPVDCEPLPPMIELAFPDSEAFDSGAPSTEASSSNGSALTSTAKDTTLPSKSA